MFEDNDILAELRNEAIDAAEDRLASVSETLDSWGQGSIKAAEAMSSIKMDIHSLKSVTVSFDMKPLMVLCHRFEDYLAAVRDAVEKQRAEIQVFTDRLSEVLDSFVQGREVDISGIVRTLPSKASSFDVSDITVTDIEVMLVMEPGTATKIVTRELLECGYRMVNVASTMEAIQLIPSMKPDLVIASRVMPELTGIDLACALKAMPTTKNIPVALIATDDKGVTTLDALPKSVPVLRKGGKFADDVAHVFVKLGIL